jgi:endonuclease/exonuclease/phosphatase family metal-dependent hydrolase
MLDILLWNLQDLFIFLDKYNGEDLKEINNPKWQLLSSSFKPNKDLEKVRAISDLIQEISPHICLFTEVGGRESLENLNEYFLNNQYEVFHKETNSDRGIDMGILVKKDISQKTKLIIHNQKVFARGVLELQIDYLGTNLTFLLTHLKSKLNLDGKDFEGRHQREKEIKKIVQIVKSHHNKNLFFCGDLNGIIYKDQTEHELSSLENKAYLKDVLEHQDIPLIDRYTYVYFNKQNIPNMSQLDYIMCSEKTYTKFAANAQILSFSGQIRADFPINKEEKLKYPSDHYPYLLKLSKF